MRPLKLHPNIPAENRLAIAFKTDYEHKCRLMELATLFGEVAGNGEPLNISATIRACINFTYGRRKAIMMRRLRAQRRVESEVQQCPMTEPSSQPQQAATPNQAPPLQQSTNGTNGPQPSEHQSGATPTTA